MSSPELVDVQDEFLAVPEVEGRDEGGVRVDMVEEAVSHFSVNVDRVNDDLEVRLLDFLLQLDDHVVEGLLGFSFLINERRK